ncbi:AMP-dependent synthetase/ligase [Parabacteroides bouchesdurhonensis]|uniref:AMP-dependent synthetase/ligase n=1 Tax=Parabacteroides bouchesdurhonensis TaxID=1936995 RepID=UPI000E4D78FF|nr:long-chain fatty acid--CoA ligase [Parabacteroides bouchesdurhonensis]RHJ94220.1 long-chain fatty acid--CoA ligase [Bacteroides sp. AM07-16]
MIYYHYAELIQRQADKYGLRTALKYRDDASGKWLKISWREFADKVMLTAEAMAEFGIGIQENIGVYSQNMPQCLYTDFAAYANRAVAVPMYATNSPAQIEYIINDADIHTLFVGEQLQYNNAFKVQKESSVLKRLIIFDSSVKLNPEDKTSVYFDDFICLGDNTHAASTVKIRMNEASPEDLATIIYTSGTTGESKGVMLHHSNFLEAMRIHDIRIPMVTDKDTSMCFLPLTHIFEKAWTCYCLHKGVKIAINRDPKMIQKTLPEIRPTLMCNVPRFWEKVYMGVQEKINSSSPFVKKIFLDAIETGRLYNLEYKNKGLKAPCALKAKFAFYDKTVFSLLKKVLGIERGRFFPVAGAPLSDTVNEFLQSVNIPIRYGYGLSETTATVCFYPEKGFVFGSIGKIMPDVQVKIDESNNEILVKGKTVTSGYYKKPEENKKSFTEDGFFRTGDAGRLEGDVLFFTERIKDLYKTSNGKYIAPQAIEGLMSSDKYIEQIAVIGDQRKFVSALIVPVYPLLEQYAEQKGLKIESREELLKNKEIIRLIESRIEEHQKNLASYERIKRFTLLPGPFTMEGRELTDTLKLRRPVVAQKYAEQIEAMYEE